MKNRDRYLPALLALTQQSKELHSSEVTDVGKMSFEQFWQNSTAPKLTGHSAVLFSADVEKTTEFLERCPVIPNGCLIISQQMCEDADALCRLFPLGLVDHPTPGGVFRWDHRRPGVNLKAILEYTQNFYTVVYMPGLQLSADILKELYSHHKGKGVLLISENLRQEMVGHADDIPLLFAANHLMIHGASDADTIAAQLPSAKVSQPVNTMVMNYHNPFTPMQAGKGMPLIGRGNDCGKPHKLSLSVSQSFSLVEKPLFDANELRQKKKDGVTVVLDLQSCDYYTVTLRESVMLSDRLHAFFDRTAGLPVGP